MINYLVCSFFGLSYFLNECLLISSFISLLLLPSVTCSALPCSLLLLILLSKIAMKVILLITSSWKLLFWPPDTPICKINSPHVSDFFFLLQWASSRPVMVLLFSSIFPLDDSGIFYFSNYSVMYMYSA